MKERRKQRKKAWYFVLAGVVVLVLVIGIGAFFLSKYKVRTIYVEGNTHYTDAQIIDMVMESRLDYYSIYLSLKYRNREIEDIPFVQEMSIKILSRDTIKIMVYEKSLAGYVEYLGRLMYFDKDGIVVESSAERMGGIPQVSGLTFDSVQLYEKLPVEDDSVFNGILSITKLLSKYELMADRIYFDDDEMTLYFGTIRVALGTSDYIDEKVTQMHYILPELSGKSGVLDMRDYQTAEDNVTFVQD